MTKYLAGVLSVIAVGVLLIAYGLLTGGGAAFASSADMNTFARPMLASERVMLDGDPYAGNPYINRSPAGYTYQPAYGNGYPAAPVSTLARPIQTSDVVQAPRVVRTQTVERVAPKRDWKKTAMVIGGSSAAGAGMGAIFGGKKGALIGAAIGGGASTIYETMKK